MSKHLHRARTHFGTDTRGLLEGGRYALLHTRTLEFDELRPYVPGDDIRDIDWKASARSHTTLIKRFVSEKHHKVLLVADAGRNMSALAPSGETKRDIAIAVMGAIGLITLGRTDEIGMVFGDARGSANIRNRRGEMHIEGMLDRYCRYTLEHPGPSDITAQLAYAATGHRRRLLIVVVSDEPDVNARLDDALTQLAGRHDVLWAMVSDMPAVGEGDGYDVSSGRFVLGGSSVGPRAAERLATAYRRAEAARTARLEAFLTGHAVPHATIGGSDEIRAKIVEMAQVFSHAG